MSVPADIGEWDLRNYSNLIFQSDGNDVYDRHILKNVSFIVGGNNYYL